MDRLNKIFTKHIDGGRFPGVQWQINTKDNIYSGKVGYNNIATKEPILDNTIYRIWSMTKPVVAIAALQLIEKNKLNLDDLVTKYLPEFSNLKVLKNMHSEIDEVEEPVETKEPTIAPAPGTTKPKTKIKLKLSKKGKKVTLKRKKKD